MTYYVTFWELSFSDWFDCYHITIYAKSFDDADSIACAMCERYGYDDYTIDND